MEDAKCGGAFTRKPLYFKDLTPPYFFRAVRSFGECGAGRDEICPSRCFRSQELFAKKPAITGDFRRSTFGERDLPEG
jgi:hypothetical protein